MDMLQRLWFSCWDKLTGTVGRVKLLRPVLVILGLYLVVSVGVGIWWSQEPEPFDIQPVVVQAADGTEHKIIGSATVSTLIKITDTLLQKQGGYLSNDRLPPGIWLDNIPNWEFGVLVQARDMSRAMRKDFSRSQSQSTEDVHLEAAEPLLHFDSDSWVLPSREGAYSRA